MTRSRGPLPPTRAASLVARTLHRQLRLAGYDRSELLAVVNELLDRLVAGEDGGPLSGVADVETGISNREGLVDALGLELRRVQELGSPLVLVFLDVHIPDWCVDTAVQDFHVRMAATLRRGVRPNDTVARLSAARYAIVLSGSPLAAASAIVRRVVTPLLFPRRAEEAPPDSTSITWRAVEPKNAEGAADLLARCAACSPEVVHPNARGTVPPAGYSRDFTATPTPSARGAVVLALGGGAARAAAHVGVLRAFENARVPIAGIAGTSAGAMVGAMYLCGQTPDEILDRFVAFTRSPAYARMRRAFVVFRRSADVGRRASALFRHTGVPLLSSTSLAAIDDEAFATFVEFFLGPDRDISELRAPFAAAATDLVAGRPAWITRGPLHFAVRASSSLPGLFAPLRDGDRVLVDGSVVSEVPIGAAHALGIDAPIVAVHLARPDAEVARFESAADVIVRASAMTHKVLVREQLAKASMLLTAHVEETGWLDFRKAKQTALIGEAAAEQFLSRTLGVHPR